MKSLLIFLAVQAMAYFFGSSDTETISYAVIASAFLLFGSAYYSAFKKDSLGKKGSQKAVFEV